MIYEEQSFQPELPELPNLSQQLLDAMPSPAFLRDLHGIILMVNEAFCGLFNCDQLNVVGLSVSDLPGESQSFLRFDEELLESGQNQQYEAAVRTAGGGSLEFRLSKSLLVDPEKKAVGIFCVMTDLTEQRQAQRGIEQAREASVIASAMLHKIRSGIVIVDNQLRVIDSNPGFAHLMGGDLDELAQTIPGLKGAKLKELVPETVFRMFDSLMSSGENMLERDIHYQNKLFHVSVITIYKNRVVGALIRDLSAPALVREEIISRAQRVNKRNMETVQKIAFLLGENASVMEELLHSIVESYNYGEDDSDG